MDLFNEDIFCEIGVHLSISNILDCFSVCKRFYALFGNLIVWNYLCDRIGNDIIKSIKNKQIYGLELYKNYYAITKNINAIGNECKFNKTANEIFIMEKMDCNSKSLGKIPKEIRVLINLCELYFAFNDVIEIPKELSQLIKLQRLDFSWNYITTIPKELCKLINLQILDFSNNIIIAIPKEFFQLVNLRTLDLYSNRINKIPKYICNLIVLENLYLDNNQISKIPKELCQLPKLRKLHLCNNQIREIPKEMKQLTNLEELYLRQKWVTLPHELNHMKHIIKI